MKEINQKRLHYFRAVLEHRSIRRAGENLAINPSVLSQQIQILEGELGIKLFERCLGASDRLVPTEAAAALSEYELENQAQQARLARYFQELRSKQRDTIRIAMGEAYAQIFMEELLNDFLRQYPDINVELRIDSTYGVMADLIDDIIHFGLVWNPPADGRVQQHASMQQPTLRLIVSRDHPLSRYLDRKIEFSDISHHSMIALLPSEFAVGRMIRSLEISEKIQINPTLTTNSHNELKKFVKSGSATLVTPFLMREEIQKGEVSSIEIETDDPIILFSKAHLITRKDKLLSDAAENLLTQTEKLSILQPPHTAGKTHSNAQ